MSANLLRMAVSTLWALICVKIVLLTLFSRQGDWAAQAQLALIPWIHTGPFCSATHGVSHLPGMLRGSEARPGVRAQGTPGVRPGGWNQIHISKGPKM
jgi:hypothetical protein